MLIYFPLKENITISSKRSQQKQVIKDLQITFYKHFWQMGFLTNGTL